MPRGSSTHASMNRNESIVRQSMALDCREWSQWNPQAQRVVSFLLSILFISYKAIQMRIPLPKNKCLDGLFLLVLASFFMLS